MTKINGKEMMQYTCIKSVTATPCTRKEAERNIGRQIKPEDCEDENGYLVYYQDGYKSWSPKAVFEKGYVCTETYVDRMKFEHAELSKKIVNGTKFYLDPDNSRESVWELGKQLEAMRQYADILAVRIYQAENSNNRIQVTSK